MKKQVIARVEMGQSGRFITVGNHELNPQEKAQDMGYDCEDEERFDKQVVKLENAFLRKHKVTHVVCYESFGDEEPRPLKEYLDQ